MYRAGVVGPPVKEIFLNFTSFLTPSLMCLCDCVLLYLCDCVIASLCEVLCSLCSVRCLVLSCCGAGFGVGGN